MAKTITEKIHKKLCKTLERGKRETKEELLKLLEGIYQEWECITNKQ